MSAYLIFLVSALVLLPAGLLRGQHVNDNDRAPALAGNDPSSVAKVDLPDKPEPIFQTENQGDGSTASSDAAQNNSGDQSVQPGEKQPKRILGVMPNFRAVSAGAIPPLPTAKEALWIATRNSFDYSSFIFVGITSLLAAATDAHPQLGEGVRGFGQYYWRGQVDKTSGNYLVIFALPTIFKHDERYYAKGHGSILKRLAYSSTRIAIAPNYEGRNSVNISELLGRGMAQGISAAYYPSGARTPGALATKYAYAFLRDAATNVFREFWPDIDTHGLHRHS